MLRGDEQGSGGTAATVDDALSEEIDDALHRAHALRGEVAALIEEFEAA